MMDTLEGFLFDFDETFSALDTLQAKMSDVEQDERYTDEAKWHLIDARNHVDDALKSLAEAAGA